MTKDSVYNGLMKFYNKNDGSLRFQGTYKNGLLDGDLYEYYPHGKIKARTEYEHGKVNGYTIMFDSLGFVKIKNFSYYDMRVGPSIEYKNGNVSNYYFYSFDGNMLFHLNYDSNLNRKITDLQTNFFFFVRRPTTEGSKYTIYIPSPPKYNFKYSLIEIKPKYVVTNVIRTFSDSKFLDTFSIPASMHNIGISLKVYDSTNQQEVTMIKTLNEETERTF